MKLKILSWNIWCDGYLEKVKDLLKKADADIISLQEVIEEKSPNISDYLTGLGYNHVFTKSKVKVVQDGRPYFLSNSIYSKYNILKSVAHVLSEFEGRMALEADIEINKIVIHVFNAHLTHAHLKPSEERELQMENVIKVLPKEKVLLMGDFNTLPENNEIKRISKILKNTDPSYAPTWSVYTEGCIVCHLKTITYKLDYMFASEDIKVLSSEVEQSKASDHLPISTIIEL